MSKRKRFSTLKKFDSWTTKGKEMIKTIIYKQSNTNLISPINEYNGIMNDKYIIHEQEYFDLVGRIYCYKPGSNVFDAENHNKYDRYAQQYFKLGVDPNDPIRFFKLSWISTVLDLLHRLHIVSDSNLYQGQIRLKAFEYEEEVRKRYELLGEFINIALYDEALWMPLNINEQQEEVNEDDNASNNAEELRELDPWIIKLKQFREFLLNDAEVVIRNFDWLLDNQSPPNIIKNDDEMLPKKIFDFRSDRSPYRIKDLQFAREALFSAINEEFPASFPNVDEYAALINRLFDVVVNSLESRSFNRSSDIVSPNNKDDNKDEPSMPSNNINIYSDVITTIISAIDSNYLPHWSYKLSTISSDLNDNEDYVRLAKLRTRKLLLCTTFLPPFIENDDWGKDILSKLRGYIESPFHHNYVCYFWLLFLVYSNPFEIQNMIPTKLNSKVSQKRWFIARLLLEPSAENMDLDGLRLKISHPQKLFSNFDRNFSGVLSSREFKTTLATLGIYDHNPEALEYLHSIISVNVYENEKCQMFNGMDLSDFELIFVKLTRLNGLIRHEYLDYACQDPSMTLGFASSSTDFVFSIMQALLLPIVALISEIMYVYSAITNTPKILLQNSLVELQGSVIYKFQYHAQKFRLYLSTFQNFWTHPPILATVMALLRFIIIILVVYSGVFTTTIFYLRNLPPAGQMTVVEGLGPVIMYIFFVFQFFFFLSPSFSYKFEWKKQYRRSELMLSHFNMRRYQQQSSSTVYRVPCDKVLDYINLKQPMSFMTFLTKCFIVIAIALSHSLTPQIVRHGWSDFSWINSPQFEVVKSPTDPQANSDASEAAILHLLYGLLYGISMVIVIDHFQDYQEKLQRFSSLIDRRCAYKYGFPYYLYFQTSRDALMWSKLRDYVISKGTAPIRRFEGFVGSCLILTFLLGVYFFIIALLGGITASPADISAAIDFIILAIFLIYVMYQGALINDLLFKHIAAISKSQVARRLYGASNFEELDDQLEVVDDVIDIKEDEEENKEEKQSAEKLLIHNNRKQNNNRKTLYLKSKEMDQCLSRVIRYMETNDHYLTVMKIRLTFDVFLRLITGISTSTVAVLAESLRVAE